MSSPMNNFCWALSPISRSLNSRSKLSIISACFVVSTYTLRLFGLFPEPGSPMLLPLFLILNTTGTAAGIGALIISGSMMSDVVEASEEQTGRREEGLFFAGTLFMQKTATGLGILVAGLLLSLAAFPEKAIVGQVPADALDAMTLYFILTTLVLGAIATAVFLRFPFGEAEHDARVAKLAVASAQKG